MTHALYDESVFVYQPKANQTILAQLLRRLQKQFQPLFSLPIKIFFCRGGHDIAPVERPAWNLDAHFYLPDPYFYIATVAPRDDSWSSWLYIVLCEPWLLKDPKLTILFSIHPGFYGHLVGQKEVNCHIFVPEISDIAKKELAWYAEKVNATQVNCCGLPNAKNHFASCFCL